MNFSLYTTACKRKHYTAMKNMKNMKNPVLSQSASCSMFPWVIHVLHVIHAVHGFACAWAKTHLAEVDAELLPVGLPANQPTPHRGTSQLPLSTGNSNPIAGLLDRFAKGVVL